MKKTHFNMTIVFGAAMGSVIGTILAESLMSGMQLTFPERQVGRVTCGCVGAIALSTALFKKFRLQALHSLEVNAGQRCRKCYYPTSGLPPDANCPECGSKQSRIENGEPDPMGRHPRV